MENIDKKNNSEIKYKILKGISLIGLIVYSAFLTTWIVIPFFLLFGFSMLTKKINKTNLTSDYRPNSSQIL